ncbi:MAG: DUF5652 family protein [Candidatus Woesebacteria bacterium]
MMQRNMWEWIILFALLEFAFKGFALWRAAQRKEKWWFIALFVINSLGILPGIYLLSHPEERKIKVVKNKRK